MEDLLWHGQALCRALSRAWEAERRAAELEAVLVDVAAYAEERAHEVADREARAYESVDLPSAAGETAGMATYIRSRAASVGVVSLGARMPQDAPEPPPTPEAVPDPQDEPTGTVDRPVGPGRLGWLKGRDT